MIGAIVPSSDLGGFGQVEVRGVDHLHLCGRGVGFGCGLGRGGGDGVRFFLGGLGRRFGHRRGGLDFRHRFFGGASGLILGRDPPELAPLVYIASALVFASTVVASVCARSAASLLLRAVRDDEDVAAQVGVRPFGVKLLAFAVASALMAAAGAVQALKLGAIEPYGMFNLRWSVDALSMVVIGGLGSRAGPVLGAAVVVLSGELLADYPEVHLALTGVLLIVVMRFAPGGVAALLAQLIARARRPRGVAL